MPPLTLEQALAALPPLTLAVEEAVHGQGAAPADVAQALRVPPPEVLRHLDTARWVRAEVARRREEAGVRSCTLAALRREEVGTRGAAPPEFSGTELAARFVDLARDWAGAREVTRRLGCSVATAGRTIGHARSSGVNIPRPTPRPRPRSPAPTPASPAVTAWLDIYCPAPSAD